MYTSFNHQQIFSVILFFSLITAVSAQEMVDIDGNVYNTVVIGEQTWMQSNLKVLHYPDGSAISEVWAYDDNEEFVATYGRLYSWNGAMHYSTEEGAQGACPDGWHIPTDTEWDQLATFLGGTSVAGGKMKEAGTDHWNPPNSGATNESGFTALPAGEYDDVHYWLLHEYAVMWSSTQTSSTFCRYRYLAYDDAILHSYNYFKDFRYSVRCIQNVNTATEDTGDHSFNISPNPVGEIMHFDGFPASDHSFQVQIFSLTGSLLLKQEIHPDNPSLNISGLPTGMYLLYVGSEYHLFISKILKR